MFDFSNAPLKGARINDLQSKLLNRGVKGHEWTFYDTTNH